ncbi:raffinose/stachyose/melibiose transport system substrate-binding protein [Evansella caseinilytica]|uniref:Raffinose/stachyose/melibiose transport system substrate-binding protein n=1 Tax=Evansella caseinilytica TaxID=1503961 RepID=A0A1H3U1L0_9BACI|nr:extracellular solute-binding protein [Evansella caseinilytica]SDZ56323.1 raffinose/stachyose/melibiose transport system substrate-binding protein [Evansella caseinilytica]
MKKILGMLMLVLIIVIAAACGNDDGEETAQGNSLSEGDKVELKIFIAQPRFKNQYESYFEQFTEKYKEDHGIDVEIILELPAADQATQILQTRLASNDSPDIFSVHAVNDIPMFHSAGYLEDLTDEPFVDTLLDAPREAVTQDGKVLALPLETLSWGYLYNKEIFAELGLELPETLTEMKEVIAALEENDITPFLASYKEAWIPQLFLPLVVGGLIHTDYPDFMEKMNQDEGSFAELEGFFEIMDLVDAHSTPRGFETDGDQGSVNFANGEAAMWVQGPWFAESILAANEGFDFGVAPLPINENRDATLINSSTTTSLAVSSDSKNKKVAKDLLNYILDENDSSALFEDLKFNHVATVHDFEPFPWLIDSNEYVAAGKAYQDPPIPQAVKSESEKAFQSYLSGGFTQEQVIEALDRAWKQYNEINK